jgi:hypothetical protein
MAAKSLARPFLTPLSSGVAGAIAGFSPKKHVALLENPENVFEIRVLYAM